MATFVSSSSDAQANALQPSTTKRAFVFITNIAPQLLEPAKPEELGVGMRNNNNTRDPRFERLRRVLAESTTGLMSVMHLEDSPFAIALYADEAHALAACKATILPPVASSPGGGDAASPLSIRLLRMKKSGGASAEVYADTITVEGETIEKDKLCPTAGLVDAYRGVSTAKWCQHSRAMEDCPLGTSCRRIHLQEFQRTVKRKRQWEDQRNPALHVPPALRIVSRWEAMIPAAHRYLSSSSSQGNSHPPQPRVFIPLLDVPKDLMAILSGSGGEEQYESLVQRVSEQLTTAWMNKATSCFVKFDAPHTAPWDWALYADAMLPALRQRCPMPPNGNPTPLERDWYNEKLLAVLNQEFNSFSFLVAASNDGDTNDDVVDVKAAVKAMFTALRSSPRSAAYMKQRLHETQSADVGASSSHDAVTLIFEPFVAIPSVMHEVVIMVKLGRITSILQRHGNVKYCTRSDGEDVARRMTVPIQVAAASIVSALIEATSPSSSSSQEKSLTCAIQCVVIPHGTASFKVAVLSIADYFAEADESSIYVEFPEGDTAATKPVFNLTKHVPVHLFPRHVLERLKEKKEEI